MAFRFTRKKIEDVLPGRIFTDEEDLFCYGFDASSRQGAPVAVARPTTVDEVSRIVRFASDNGIPIVPRGAGTGMTGGSVPLEGAVILSLDGMNRILEIDEKNMVAVVEPGVINSHLQEKVEARGLFYPPDPASMGFCTLGGNIAENAGGPRAIKYGVTRDYVLGLEVVLPDGRLLTTGGRTFKGVVGYDLTGLVVGSEGTLGVVTKIVAKLLPLPEEIVTLLCTYSSEEDAAQAVAEISTSGIVPRTLEFMDYQAIHAVENYKPCGLPEDAQALLLIEVDGSHNAVRVEGEKIGTICSTRGGNVQVADDVFSKQRLWDARRAVSPALYHIKPTKLNEDIVVPRGRITEMLAALRAIADRYQVIIANFGHAGDGNIHVNVMTDRNDEDEYRRAQESVEAIFEAALRLGGTISGEHGVGLTKRPYLSMELSQEVMKIMKSIKSIFDPQGIMNPGKIFPPESETVNDDPDK